MTDKRMQWLHKAQLILSVDISPQFPQPSKDPFKTLCHLHPVRDIGNLIPCSSLSYFVNNRNHSKIKPQTTSREEGNSTRFHVCPADTLTITLDISEYVRYRDTGHQEFWVLWTCTGPQIVLPLSQSLWL